MAKDYIQKERKKKKIKRVFYYLILLIVVSFIVTFAVLAFNIYGVIAILIAMVIYNFTKLERNDI